MSYDLGHSKSYINNITSGRCLPPMKEFFEICRYLEVTPAAFFDTSLDNPALLQMAIDELRKLNDEDIMLIINHMKRLTKDQ